MIIGKIEFFFICILTLNACSIEKKIEVEESEAIMIDELPQDFAVPDVVWQSMKPRMPEDREKPILYNSVKVLMKEKNKNVLKKPLIAIEFPRGGGDININEWMGTQAGSFHLSFELPEFETALSKKIFFLSESRQRKVDGEILGSGCRKILDITTALIKQMKVSGIKINTTRLRHDSILGGHLIFLVETEKSWLLSQVTFFDSARPDLFCKGYRTVAEAR